MKKQKKQKPDLRTMVEEEYRRHDRLIHDHVLIRLNQMTVLQRQMDVTLSSICQALADTTNEMRRVVRDLAERQKSDTRLKTLDDDLASYAVNGKRKHRDKHRHG